MIRWGTFQIAQLVSNLILEIFYKNKYFSFFKGLYQCHDTGGNQDWTYNKNGQIKHHDLCLTLVNFVKGSMVIMKICDDTENQKWKMRDGGLLQHNKMNLCLDSRYIRERGIVAERCNSALNSQIWNFITKSVS